jgi:hypothetical protein
MAESATPAELARDFTKAWTSRDMDTSAAYLADDVIFDGPNSHTADAAAYIEFLGRFASSVTSANIIAVFGDDTQAMIMYEVTNQAGTWTCAELLTFSGGKIQKDLLTFSLNARG